MPTKPLQAKAIPARPLSSGTSRREFLKNATAVAATWAAVPQAEAGVSPALTTIALGPHRVTRLIAGSNPLYGGSHFNQLLSALMREHFTDERVIEFLRDCERAGINTWQSSFGERPQRLLRLLREAGSRLNWICLAGAWDANPATTSPADLLSAMMRSATLAAQSKPLGIVYHGEISDKLWRAGKLEQIRDFLSGVHELGFPVGVSTHNPAVIEAIEEKGWPTDFYMACFYRASRIREEFVKEIGVAPVGETYLASDPPKMCKVIRQVRKPCLGFKILAAGRRCNSPQQVREAFGYAYQNIKPADAVIVGMFPKFSDQIAENVRLAREFG